ncbi:MAG: trehalose-phosphatase [Ideonella sp.]|nr:trehalose-phosphatase [Ideonella sp.]
MQHLFTPQGEAALASLLSRRPLLAFDFDGTLAPIVASPDRARIAPQVSARLRALGQRLPVAIVTGRSVDDVRSRLGFEPTYIVGNHGAEDPFEPVGDQAHVVALDPMRALLRSHGAQLDAAGVVVEDKGQSIALHYRRSRARARARALIRDLLVAGDGGLRVFAGKMVVNIAASDAPDKADAVHRLVQRCGASCALFAGDDVNDEPVFASAPADWVTVRVGRAGHPSSARFHIDNPGEVARLLGWIVARLGDRAD